MSENKMNDVPESSGYDNYLDAEKNETDEYSITLDRFIKEKVVVPFNQKVVEKDDFVRLVKVHLLDLDAHREFCNLMKQIIPHEKNEIYYPLEPANALFPVDDSVPFDVDVDLITPKKNKPNKSTKSPALDVEVENVQTVDKEWKSHWKGMPSFIQEECESYKSVWVKIRTDKDLEKFAELTDNSFTEKTKFVHFPRKDKANNLVKRWIGPASIPKYPMYIISKGRHESMFTSRTFAKMEIPHYIVIEPQDYDNYVEALDKFNINPYATLLVAPFSNHGDGPGRARNWSWDHSIHLGAERHWVFDDNIKDFYRLQMNNRYRVMTGSIFNAMEDFVDRYTNVMLAGPNYYFFCASTQTYPAYVANTRIYSALLIKNDCRHRWRGRYNEDTDLSLRVLKDGDATVQFNAFLQGKVGTQLLKGGNTEEFYHKEGDVDKEKWREGVMNASGTINKSKMLWEMHPDVTTLVWKYGRAHHHVDYSKFMRNNKLIMKPGIEIPQEENEYGMEFTDTYDYVPY